MPAKPPPPAGRPFPSGERGIALMLVFLLVLILVPFAAEFATQVGFESRTAHNVTDQLLIENAIDGQFEIALTRLRYDATHDAKTDTYNDDWNSDEIRERTEDDVGVTLSTRIFDEQAKFDLRLLAQGTEERKALAKARLKALLLEFRTETAFELADSEAEAWADAISDHVNGRRNVTLPNPKRTSNPSIHVLEELNFLEPIREHRADWLLHDQRDGEKIAEGLHRFVTVYGTGKLNLNTADVRVLKAYFLKNPEIAEQIVERREGAAEEDTAPGGTTPPPPPQPGEGTEEGEAGGNPFTEVNQVSEVEGVTPELLAANQVDLAADFDVRSNHYSLRIVAVTEMTRRDELFVVERVPGRQQDAPLEGFRFHLHQERTDALEDFEALE